MAKLFVIDVGKGNCTVLADKSGVFLFDAGPSDIARFVLERDIFPRLGFARVKALLFSHCDDDHTGGAPAAIGAFGVEYAAMPPHRRTSRLAAVNRTYRELRTLEEAKKCKVVTTLCQSTVLPQPDNGLRIQIVAPSDSIGGAVSKPDHHRCAVFRIVRGRSPLALIAGDINSPGLAEILKSNSNESLRAPLLIYPHHGGEAGSKHFPKKLLEVVQPSQVFFSVPPNSRDFPRKEILDLIVREFPKIRILCTGVNQHCNPKGALELSCATHDNGFFEYDLRGEKLVAISSLRAHKNRVRREIPSPVCRP